MSTAAVFPPTDMMNNNTSNVNNNSISGSNDLELPWPLFDVFLDVPHPAASPSCPPVFTIASPDSNEDIDPSVLSQISRFAFPEYDSPVTSQQQQQSQQQHVPGLNRYDRYAMQSPGFQHFTFTLQLQSGTRLHGHVRRYLPHHVSCSGRYDVGRRGERALVLLTKCAGADALYAAILKSVEAISSQQAALSSSSLASDKNPNTNLQPRLEPQKWFLVSLSRYQQHLASVYIGRPMQERGKPLVASLEGLELGLLKSPLYRQIDVTRFLMPTSLLHRPKVVLDPSATNASSSILPLLRCVSITHALRFLAAILSERRVILTSASPTRLCQCSHAALAILAQGMLHWQHLYIPVLPPHLWQYLAAPYPYLIGILSSSVSKLNQAGESFLGEVLILNLDTDTMETRGMDAATIHQRLPDLFQQMMQSGVQTASSGIQSVGIAANNATAGAMNNLVPISDSSSSAAQYLAQDLAEVLRNDKRLLQGGDMNNPLALANKSIETAAKTVVAVKNTFSKIRDQVIKQQQQQRSRSSSSYSMGGGSGESSSSLSYNMTSSERSGGFNASGSLLPQDESPGGNGTGTGTGTGSSSYDSSAADYIFTEGCHNETCEEEARVAFATFFLCMIGNMRWYLAPPSSSNMGEAAVPQLDRNRFLQQKRALGDGEGKPMWSLLQNFVQTQMLEEFAKARVEELRLRKPLAPDAPLFAKCAHLHRQQNIEFGILSVRRVCQQVSSSSSSRITGSLQTNARRSAMALTSNKAYEGGNYNEDIATLVEHCRECSSVLFDVMSVIWNRLRDASSRGGGGGAAAGIGGGMNMKQASQALALLRNLLFHGPLGAITEATDGLDRIRSLKFYENTGLGRAQGAQQIRTAATEVYNVLVDRAKLFRIRRFCAERRREIVARNPRPQRNPRMELNAPFRNLHAFASPAAATGTVVRIPAATAPSRPAMDRGSASADLVSGVGPEPPEDWLGMSSPDPVASSSTDDIFGLTSAAGVPSPSPSASSFGAFGDTSAHGSTANDVLGLLGGLNVSSGVQTPLAASAPPPANPFAVQTPPQPSSSAAAPPPSHSYGVVAPQPSPAPSVSAPVTPWSGQSTRSSSSMPAPPLQSRPTPLVLGGGGGGFGGPMQQQQQTPVHMPQLQQKGSPIPGPSLSPAVPGQQPGSTAQPHPTYQYQQQQHKVSTSGPPSLSSVPSGQQQHQAYQYQQQQQAMRQQQQQSSQFAFPPAPQLQQPPPHLQGPSPHQQHYSGAPHPQQFGASPPPANQIGTSVPPHAISQQVPYQQQQQHPPFLQQHQQQRQQQAQQAQRPPPPQGPFGAGIPPTQALVTPTAYSGQQQQQQPHPFGAASPPLPQQQQPNAASTRLSVPPAHQQQQQPQPQPSRRSQFDPFV